MELPVHFADRLRGRISIRHTAPGEGIIRGGDAGESLFWILEGALAIVQGESRVDPYSGIFWHTTAELKAGDWFGEASLLTGAPRRATVVAISPCELAEIPKEAFESVLRADPNFIEHLAGVMERRNHELSAERLDSLPPKDQWRSAIKAWFGLG
jgi:CRP-like cAMP-binding protein